MARQDELMRDRKRIDAGRSIAPRARLRILLGLVTLSVGLQLVNALLVKLAAATPSPPLLVFAGLLFAVLALGFVRFVIWSGIYKRYPISLAYPLSAIFFPGVVLMAWAMGEPIGAMQVAGATLVMAGVALVVTSQPHPAGEPTLPIGD
jgi:drug/metabolite transporter (DMT)-like permease